MQINHYMIHDMKKNIKNSIKKKIGLFFVHDET